MRPLRLLVLLVLAIPALVAGVSDARATTTTGPWAAESEATVHPGVRTVTEGAQCTANFVFSQIRTLPDGKRIKEVFLGQAAHCASKEHNTATDGCRTETFAPGETPVEIEGASRRGVLVYSSWWTMQQVGETDPEACAYNDFALVKVHPHDYPDVNPTVPVWGGPDGLSGPTVFGDAVYTYGRSRLRLGLQSAREGSSIGTYGDGWTHSVYTVTPGIPGDSGSAFLDREGRALGILSTVAIAPFPASNGVTDLRRALAYMQAHTDTWDGLALVAGTRGFEDTALP